MKGISTVLTVVLLVIVTVAIIGLAYAWASGLFRTTTEAGTEQVNIVTSNLQKTVEIISSNCNSTNGEINFVIKNTGSKAILKSELGVYLGSVSATTTPALADITIGATASYNVTGTKGVDNTLVVSAPAGEVSTIVSCL